MPVSVATAIASRSCSESLRDLLEVAGKHGLERLDFCERGFLLDHDRHAIEAIDELRINRMLDPQRAVLVEGRDALLRRYEVLA